MGSKAKWRGVWVVQSVKCSTSAQVMISGFMGSSPSLASVLTAQSLESALDSVSLSLCPSPARALFSPPSKMNKLKKIFFKGEISVNNRSI